MGVNGSAPLLHKKHDSDHYQKQTKKKKQNQFEWHHLMTPANPVAKEIEYRNHTYKTAGNLNSSHSSNQLLSNQLSDKFCCCLIFFFFQVGSLATKASSPKITNPHLYYLQGRTRQQFWMESTPGMNGGDRHTILPATHKQPHS